MGGMTLWEECPCGRNGLVGGMAGGRNDLVGGMTLWEEWPCGRNVLVGGMTLWEE